MSDPENELDSQPDSSAATDPSAAVEDASPVTESEDAAKEDSVVEPADGEGPSLPEPDASVDASDASGDTPDAPAPPAPAPPPPAPAPPPPAPVSSKPAIDPPDDIAPMDWYILKVAFNREDSIAGALQKRVKMEGMEEHIEQIVVPTEDVATFTRDGKRRISKRKLLPGYIMVYMRINDDTWFLVRETGGISDFTGAAGKPMPMEPEDVERFINRPVEEDDEEEIQIKTNIPFKVGDRVRVKEGNFENQEGDVDAVDESNGRVTVIINIFDRSVPMELDHWQVEPL